MTAHGSPATGESTEYTEEHEGRRCRVVQQDWDRHSRKTMGRTWAPHEHFAKVYEYEPEPEPVHAPTEPNELPERVRETPEPEVPAPATAAEPGKRAESRVDKFAYHKALRGRFGKGRELTDTEYIVLNLLWDYADGDLANARPGSTRLAEDLGYSGPHATKTVRGHVKSLERKRFIVCTRKSGGRGRAATYRLTLPEWESSRPPGKGGAVPSHQE